MSESGSQGTSTEETDTTQQLDPGPAAKSKADIAVEVDRAVSRAMLRIRQKSPFFATLAMHARYFPTTIHSTMCTDGSDIYINPDFLETLTPDEADGVLLHEVLHAALQHVPRISGRDPKIWNIAADIVVNSLVVSNDFVLPEGALRDYQLENFSVEEIYALLLQQQHDHQLDNQDLMPGAGEDQQPGKPGDKGAPGKDGGGPPKQGSGADSLGEQKRRTAETKWKQAAAQAKAIGQRYGNMPAGAERAFGTITSPTLDWRSVLWRFLTRTPTDFAGFDRRFVHDGLYLETLEGESVRVFVCVDTSGSIDEEMIRALLSEVTGILGAYPSTECLLWFADADLYGPYEIRAGQEFPTPQGGGGTDFRPFFHAVEQAMRGGRGENSVCVYLTDGYGPFPDTPPRIPTLWAVVPGGIQDNEFPFGEVVRLIE